MNWFLDSFHFRCKMIPYKHKAKKTFHPQPARKTFGTCKAVAQTGASISHLQQALSGNSSQHLLDTEKNGNTSDSHSDVYTNETVESDPFFPDGRLLVFLLFFFTFVAFLRLLPI